MARRPGGDQSPAPRSVSNRRHGAPAPPSPSMMAARRSRAAWLRCRAPPVDRQHPAALSRNPAPASTRPVDARLGPVRPASARRPASEPPSTRPHTPNRRLARASVVRSARLRPVRSALSRLSAAHQRSVRCDLALNPALAVHVAASPARGSRSSCPAAACADPQGPPAPPPRPPAQFPAGAGTRAHTYARACGVEIFREKTQKGRAPGASAFRPRCICCAAVAAWAPRGHLPGRIEDPAAVRELCPAADGGWCCTVGCVRLRAPCPGVPGLWKSVRPRMLENRACRAMRGAAERVPAATR